MTQSDYNQNRSLKFTQHDSRSNRTNISSPTDRGPTQTQLESYICKLRITICYSVVSYNDFIKIGIRLLVCSECGAWNLAVTSKFPTLGALI
jgi:hypothetical protein